MPLLHHHALFSPAPADGLAFNPSASQHLLHAGIFAERSGEDRIVDHQQDEFRMLTML